LDDYQFGLSKDESEIRVRILKKEKSFSGITDKGKIDEYIMTETIPGKGFNNIAK
jgi:hypothetical protein